MKYNFEKLMGSGVQKFQTPAAPIQKGRWRKDAINDTDLRAKALDTWDTYHGPISTIYKWLIDNKKYKSLTADTLNKLIQPDLFKGKELNKLGYTNWNNLFNTTGINEYFGYSKDRSDYLGPTTWQRNALLTALAQKHNSAESALDTDSGKIYFDTTQNKWVPVQTTVVAQPGNPAQTEAGISGQNTNTQADPSKNQETTGATLGGNNTTPSQELYDQDKALKKLQEIYDEASAEKPIWTDWAPITQQYLNNTLKAYRNNSLSKKFQYPHYETPWLNSEKYNYFVTRQLQQKTLDNVLANISQYKSNDINNMLAVNQGGLEFARQTQDNQAQLQQKGDNESTQIKQQVIDNNLLRQAEVANKNNQINAAANNAIIEADKQLNAEIASNRNQFGERKYTNHGQFKHDADVNDIVRSRELNNLKAAIDERKLYLTQADMMNYKKSKAYEAFKNSFNRDEGMASLSDADKAIMTGDDEAAKEAVYERLWGDQSNTYRTKNWAEELEGLKNDWRSQLQIIRDLAQFHNGIFPYYIDNQGLYTGQYRRSTYKSVFDDQGNFRIPYKKSGGKVVQGDRLSKWIAASQKERERVSKSQLETSKLLQRQLERDLGQIDKETLILLKSIFK